jgi:hypothetical protein
VIAPAPKSALRLAREAIGATAIDIGYQTGIPEARLYMIERGRFNPRPMEAERLSKLFGKSVIDLFPRMYGHRREMVPS